MKNINIGCFCGANFGVTFAVAFASCVLVAFAITMFFMWWVDVKKKTIKSFFVGIKNGISKAIECTSDFFSNNKVKTVYSNKALNYSGTEFLPIPSKQPNEKFTYEFLGWEKCGKDAGGNVIVRAIYLQKTKKCFVNVYDDDKITLIKSFEIDFGAGIDLSNVVLKKEDTKEFSFEFAGWDKDIKAFYKNENVYAVYKAIPKKFTYTFKDYNGDVVSSGTAIYGTPIIPPASPVRQNEDGKVFRFSGWRNFRENSVLVKDAEFVAEYIEGQEASVLGSTIVNLDGEQFELSSVQTNAIKEENERKENNLKLKKNNYRAPIFDFNDEVKLKNKEKKEKLEKPAKPVKVKEEKPIKKQGYSVISETEREYSSPMLQGIDFSVLTEEDKSSPAIPTKTNRVMTTVKAKPSSKKKSEPAEVKVVSAKDDDDMKDITPLTAQKTKNITGSKEEKVSQEKSPLEGIMVNHRKIAKPDDKK